MCYNVASALKTLIKYAKHRRDDPAYIQSLEKMLEDWPKTIKAFHFVSGFAHPKLLVFTNEKPLQPQVFYWGLIPSWVKSEEQAKKLMNQTLNARFESMFEKPSYRNSATKKRCLIYVDAFFEFHQFMGKKYPFRISMADNSPLIIAGLWDEWANPETGEIISTVSIVTTKAEGKMAEVHNKPEGGEPRMPVILTKENQEEWLMEINTKEDREKLMKLCVLTNQSKLNFITTKPLLGKNGVGNSEEAGMEFIYPELTLQ